MKAVNLFLSGAAVGALVALLYAPERGEDLRFRIKTMLKKKGYLKPDQIDLLAAQIAAQLEESKV